MSDHPFTRLRKNWLGQYSKKLKHQGKDVCVNFIAETKEELEPLLPTAAQFWKRRSYWIKTFRDYALANLLDELNDRKPKFPGFVCVTKSKFREYIAVPFSVNFYTDSSPEDVVFELCAGETKYMFEFILKARGTLADGLTEWEFVSLV